MSPLLTITGAGLAYHLHGQVLGPVHQTDCETIWSYVHRARILCPAGWAAPWKGVGTADQGVSMSSTLRVMLCGSLLSSPSDLSLFQVLALSFFL